MAHNKAWCKVSKNVYFSDGHLSIMTSYHAKMTSYIAKKNPPSLSENLQNCFEKIEETITM